MELGYLEKRLLGIVKRLGRASGRDVLRQVSAEKDLAYTTITTTLRRLHSKGFLAIEKITVRGRPMHIFVWKENEVKEREVINKTLDGLIEAFGSSAISLLYKRLGDVRPETLKALKKEIAARRRR